MSLAPLSPWHVIVGIYIGTILAGSTHASCSVVGTSKPTTILQGSQLNPSPAPSSQGPSVVTSILPMGNRGMYVKLCIHVCMHVCTADVYSIHYTYVYTCMWHVALKYKCVITANIFFMFYVQVLWQLPVPLMRRVT